MDTVRIFSGTSLQDLETRIADWAAQNQAGIVSAQTVLGPVAPSGQVDYFLVTVVFSDSHQPDR